MIKALFASVWLVFGFGALHAADWPTFRGADRKDISTETGLLKEWPEGGPKRLWLNNTLGLGYSGYSIVNGTLYTLGSRDSVEYLIALDASTGVEKWAAEVAPMLTNGYGNGPRSTPTVDGDRIYAMSGKGNLICVNAKDGVTIWKVSMADFGGKVPGWGYTESPLVDGGNVICTPGGSIGTLLALDKSTGAKVWQTTDWTDGAQYASVIAADVNNTHQFIQLTQKNLGGVDAKDGKVMWKMAFPGKTAVIPTPIYRDGKAYVAAGYGVGCMMVDVSAGNSASQVYANNVMVNHHGGVILVGDYLYGYSEKGGWMCQDWKTGEEKWSSKNLRKGAIHCADGMFYLLEEGTGTVVLIEASPEGWKEHGRFKLDPQTTQRSTSGKIWTHPVVCNGKLYLRDQELLFCFDVKG